MSQETDAINNGRSDAFAWATQDNGSSGMSKRELMATAIMAGSTTSIKDVGNDKYKRDLLAVSAVKAADALLLALEQVV